MTENNNLKFESSTITFSEIRELSVLVNSFFQKSGIVEKIKDKENFSPLTDIPEMILKDDQTMRDFLKVVEFCTGIDIDDAQGLKTMQLIQEVLIFINEVNVTSFLLQTAMTLLPMIKE